MKRKKVGATLITVVTIFSAVLVVGAALAAMTAGDYKMKQMQSNRIHNLYGADSGLDAAYDALVADFDVAGNYAGFKVKQLKAGKEKIKGNLTDNQQKYNSLIEEDTNLEKNHPKQSPEWYEAERKRIQRNENIVINAEFKRCFKLFFNESWAKAYDGEYVANELKNINNKDTRGISYAVQINASGTENDKAPVDLNNNIDKSNIVHRWIKVNTAVNPAITVEASNITIDGKNADVSDIDNVDAAPGASANDNFKVKQCGKIKIASTFQTDKEKDGEVAVGANKRTVETTYNLSIPNYDDIYFIGQDYKPYIYNAYNRPITVFGDMQVDKMGTYKLTVDGDVYVFGNNTSNSNMKGSIRSASTSYVNDKYRGGISLNGDSISSVEFKGNVFTGETFNIQNNVDVVLDKDVYALNVYAGKQNGDAGDNSSLNIAGSLITDNDLTLKSTATTISMKNFYGINDKHVGDNSDSNKVRNSSSILVNTYKGNSYDKNSSINISNEAYIMGVAYIDTANPYQTGESVGVKGNYKAYSEKTANDKNDFTFGPNSPLYLIKGKVLPSGDINENISAKEKEEHFIDYWNENKNKDKLETGEITFDDPTKIYSAGAVVYIDGNSKRIQPSNYDLDNTPSTILAKRRAFAQNVYNLGKKTEVVDKDGEAEEQQLDELYNNPPSDIMGKFMELNKVPEKQTGKKIYNDENIGVFNKDNKKKVVILGKGAQYKPSDSDIVFDERMSGEVSAFIATAGDVIIDGAINYNGNIITAGNLMVQGSGEKTITYSEEAALSIQRVIPDVFADVFFIGGRVDDSASPDENSLKIDYDLSKFLRNLLWKIRE